ncbi:hypothetical protein AYI69_g6421 [Smittium culicis]|uniref:Uncharacterized protein n=1 Tax=Smittium culicis TaxID=133412 RepID=A0A1R1XZ92_9FUNG|nr:hypothetical protein AYI69_g6421 [Smittium culicis]
MFPDWGNTAEDSDKNLTLNHTWLLAVTGFLRASDIHRIDDSKRVIAQGILNLAIVAANEKRKGRPIIRPCQISRNTDQILCPVYTYETIEIHKGSFEAPHGRQHNPLYTLAFGADKPPTEHPNT